MVAWEDCLYLSAVNGDYELVGLHGVVVTLAGHHLPPAELSSPAPPHRPGAQTPARDSVDLLPVPGPELVYRGLPPGEQLPCKQLFTVQLYSNEVGNPIVANQEYAQGL